jgi:hypothetical protein
MTFSLEDLAYTDGTTPPPWSGVYLYLVHERDAVAMKEADDTG